MFPVNNYYWNRSFKTSGSNLSTRTDRNKSAKKAERKI